MSLDVKLGRGLFEANLTHNLNKMAEAAGIYGIIWRPDENGIKYARQLVAPLASGIARLRMNPGRFRPLEPANKWGTYDDFIPWLERYLAACKRHPRAKVSVNR